MPASPPERELAPPSPPPARIVKDPEPTPRTVKDSEPTPTLKIEMAPPRVLEEPPVPLAATPPTDPEPRPPPSPPRAALRSPPSALVEPRPRSPPPPEDPPSRPEEAARPRPPTPDPPKPRALVNGFMEAPVSRIGAAVVDRAWSGDGPARPRGSGEVKSASAPWARAGGGSGGTTGAGGRRAPAATSVVFNFSNRKEVPDYIENDGLILRASRRDRIKAGEPGVVVLRPELAFAGGDGGDGDGEDAGGDDRAVSPCGVRFVNDNVLINGRSCMPQRRDTDRLAKLKLQFDDSLTRTFEYPSETSLCEEPADATYPSGNACPPEAGCPAEPACPPERACPPAEATRAQQLAEPAHLAPLAANTHLASAALARYTPSKTCARAFQLGVTRHAPPPPPVSSPAPAPAGNGDCADGAEQSAGGDEESGDARPCGADAARSWSEARTLATDLLF